jgi:hypothetical protein
MVNRVDEVRIYIYYEVVQHIDHGLWMFQTQDKLIVSFSELLCDLLYGFVTSCSWIFVI